MEEGGETAYEVNRRGRVTPEAPRGEVRGEIGAVEEMGSGVGSETAPRAEVVIGSSDAMLVSAKVAAVTRTKLGEYCAPMTG